MQQHQQQEQRRQQHQQKQQQQQRPGHGADAAHSTGRPFMASPGPSPAPPGAGDDPVARLAHWREHRAAAVLWLVITSCQLAFIFFLAWCLTPPMGQLGPFYSPPLAEAGLAPVEALRIVAAAAAMCLCLTAVQDLAWPFVGAHRRGEKVFFCTSLSVRAAFISTLVYFHYGPNRASAGFLDDAGHRHALMALFYAGYTSDILQIWRRPSEFSKSFASFMVSHHLLSFLWFTPWLAFAAPHGPQGAAIFNTVFVYLCAAVPNHTYKLASCWYKPAWYAFFLMGPSIWGHWLVLLSSQRYYFMQCMCSAYRCWYPAAIFMQAGAWGMAVFFDYPNFCDSLMFTYSKSLGHSIGIRDVLQYSFQYGRGARPCPGPCAAAEPRAAPAPRVASEECEPVEVELVFKAPKGARGTGATSYAKLGAGAGLDVLGNPVPCALELAPGGDALRRRQPAQAAA